MATTKTQIREWLENGIKMGATHMVMCCDTYDHSDYPSYVMPYELAESRIRYIGARPMTRIMEVYNLSMDIESQLNEHRAWHL